MTRLSKVQDYHEAPGTEYHSHRLASAKDAKEFTLDGNATLSLVSQKTKVRFTYKVTRKGETDRPIYFVSLLNGPSNDDDFQYMGVIKPQTGEFSLTAKSKIGPDAPSFQAFNYFWRWTIERSELPKGLEVWHEGRCGRCGRKLTVPSSIENGIGPECMKKGGFD